MFVRKIEEIQWKVKVKNVVLPTPLRIRDDWSRASSLSDLEMITQTTLQKWLRKDILLAEFFLQGPDGLNKIRSRYFLWDYGSKFNNVKKIIIQKFLSLNSFNIVWELTAFEDRLGCTVIFFCILLSLSFKLFLNKFRILSCYNKFEITNSNWFRQVLSIWMAWSTISPVM